jgi:fucose 4-O-acetylase-like acetyltransferase
MAEIIRKERIVWLDYLRIFAIYFVVVSHTPVNAEFNLPLTYIRMPFFFLCSGLMFNIQREGTFWDFLKKKARSLLIPFATFHIISYPFWLIFDRNFGADVVDAYPWYEPLPDVLLGRFAIDDAPLWFLTALFTTEIIYFFIAKYLTYKQKLVLFPVLVIIGYLSQAFISVKLPFMLQTVAVAIVFYALGNIFKEQIFTLGKKSCILHCISLILFGSILYFASIYNGKIAMHINQYGNFWLFLPISFVALLASQSFAVILEHIFSRRSWIEYISRNLIIIVGLHIMVGKFLKFITFYIFNIPLSVYQDTILPNLVFSLVSILLLVPIMMFVNRFCPKLIGKF